MAGAIECCSSVASDKPIVLVVDDEPMSRAIHSASVRRLGYRPVERQCGEGAVRAFQESIRSGQDLAAIIMDINMPGLDGLEAVWRIRELEASPGWSCICRGDAVVPSRDNGYPYCNCTCSHSNKGLSSAQDQYVPMDFHTDISNKCDAPRLPIWAVSACSVEDQAKSPVMRLLRGAGSGPPWEQAGFDAFVSKSEHQLHLLQLLTSLRPRQEARRQNIRGRRLPNFPTANSASPGSSPQSSTSYVYLQSAHSPERLCRGSSSKANDSHQAQSRVA